jgi:hypothetical protein
MAYSPLPDNSSVVTLGWGQTSDGKHFENNLLLLSVSLFRLQMALD